MKTFKSEKMAIFVIFAQAIVRENCQKMSMFGTKLTVPENSKGGSYDGKININ